MHINGVTVNGIWVSFDIENVESISEKGVKSEEVQAVATFVRAGEQIHKIYNVGSFDFCAKLLDDEFAKSVANRMIESANRSAHSPFLSK
jgi:hypothetical protein|nr:MAG TPA: hypothetical protein [Caudoviricetes sp.]